MTHQITLGPELAGTRQRFDGNDGQDIVVTLDNGFTDGQFVELVRLPTLTSNLTILSTYGFIYQLTQSGTIRATFVDKAPAPVGWDYDVIGVSSGGASAPITDTILKGDSGGGITATEVRYNLGPDWTGNNYNPTGTLTLGHYEYSSTDLIQGMLQSQGNLAIRAANGYNNIGDNSGYNVTIVGGNAGYGDGSTLPSGGSIIIQPGRTYNDATPVPDRGTIQLRTQSSYGVTPGTLFAINDKGAFGFATSDFSDPPMSNADFGVVGQVLTSRGEFANPQWATVSGGGGSGVGLAVYNIIPMAAASFDGTVFDLFTLNAERSATFVQPNSYNHSLEFSATGWYELIVEGTATSTYSSTWPDGLTSFGTSVYGPLMVKRTTHTRYGHQGYVGESNSFLPTEDKVKTDWTDIFTFRVEVAEAGSNSISLGFFSYVYNPGPNTVTFSGQVTIKRLSDL